MALATEADLEARLGRDLTDEEAAQADALLGDVSAAIEIYTGRKFHRDTYQLRTRVKRGRVRLPYRPVHDVASVTDRFGDSVRWEWDGIDTVFVDCCAAPGQAPLQVVDITYDGGPDDVPPAILGIVCAIALRSLGVDPTEASITQESVDGYAFTIGSTGGGRAFGVLPSEAKILAKFTGPTGVGSMRVAW